ncbi:MAG: hypothetical protein AB1894_05530 [Chloroflexota bacterium]
MLAATAWGQVISWSFSKRIRVSRSFNPEEMRKVRIQTFWSFAVVGFTGSASMVIALLITPGSILTTPNSLPDTIFNWFVVLSTVVGCTMVTPLVELLVLAIGIQIMRKQTGIDP